MILFRSDFKHLSIEKLNAAKVLFDNRCFSDSYYLAGLSLECALKACISKQTKSEEFPDKSRAQKCFDHKLDKLIEVAGLKGNLKEKQDSNPVFDTYWAIVKDWDINVRYNVPNESIEVTARDFLKAITDEVNGVQKWISKYW